MTRPKDARFSDRPAATYDIGPGVARAFAEWNRPVYSEAILADAKTLELLVENLEARGVTIFFYELPYSPIIDRSSFATTTRKTIEQVFGPRNNRWLKLEYPADELRWTEDGAHLDERSALIVGSALANAIDRESAPR